MKALIIESDEVNYNRINECFKENTFETIWMRSGNEALSVVGRNNFHIVCTNYNLRDMKGTDFCAELNIKVTHKNYPVILLIDNSDPDIYYEALISGLTDVFSLKNLSEFKNYLNLFKKSQDDSLENSRIVLVEDSTSMARVIKKNLEGLGCKVAAFTTAEDAFSYLQENDCDAIITDIVLPGNMTGLSFIRNVRNFEGNKKIIPILVITAFDDDARRLEILKEGVFDYIKKPFKRDELIIRLKNLIKNKNYMDNLIESKHRLEENIMKDHLTGLYNRYFLLERGKKKIKEAKRHGYPLSMVVIDIDHFKRINDQYGHSMGDNILIEIANLLRRNCREEDIVARYGGEEFVLMLAYCKEEDAFIKSEELRKKIEELNPFGIKVTSSFGVASICNKTDIDITFEDLFAMADLTMYIAKDKGRNRVLSYSKVNSG